MDWRLVDSDLREPAYTVAADEAMALARSKDTVPNTLHLYRRSRPTVSLGYFQKADVVLDREFCARNGVTIVRRITGGSAIYTDQNQLIYGLALSEESLPGNREEAFAKVCSGIVLALKALGIEAEFKPVNDVLVKGRKISGSAQMRRWGIILQQGTLILKNEPGMMQGALRMDMEKVRNRGLTPETYVTSLAEELGQQPEIGAVKDALVNGFGKALGVRFTKMEFTEFEKQKIEELVITKYGRDEWNLRK